MIPATDDLPDDAIGAISLADAYRDYACKTLIDIYGYSHVATIGTDARFHFFAAPDGHIGTAYFGTVNFRPDVNGHDLKSRPANTPDVKEYVLRGFEDLEDETDSGSRRLTRELEKGFLRLLIRGYLIAWGRENSPLRDWMLIQPSAWQVLRPTQLHLGIVEGLGGALLFDVRIKPSTRPGVQRPRKIPRPSTYDVVNDRLSRLIEAELTPPGTKLREVATQIQGGLKRAVPKMEKSLKTIEGHIREQFNARKVSPANNAK